MAKTGGQIVAANAPGVALTKASIDLGLVVKDLEAATVFYRDVLGLSEVGDQPMPGGTMRRLQCGTSTIKLISPKRPPAAEAASGGIFAATGYRYWTISVSNLDEVITACTAAGRVVPVPRTQARPGVSIAMVADPDGNLVELMEAT
jgi:catechol 2,3-dioxygenase-like lactoylglutathione lyase family enzyme